MGDDDIGATFDEELVSACRTTVGDELRSITRFTDDDVDQLYLRDDLEQSADLVGFADHERYGFRSQSLYEGTELGDYRATIRMFEDGYLTRVVVGDVGVWVTTDTLSVERFEELASALGSVLADSAAS